MLLNFTYVHNRYDDRFRYVHDYDRFRYAHDYHRVCHDCYKHYGGNYDYFASNVICDDAYHAHCRRSNNANGLCIDE